jgi:hypothetical protein
LARETLVKRCGVYCQRQLDPLMGRVMRAGLRTQLIAKTEIESCGVIAENLLRIPKEKKNCKLLRSSSECAVFSLAPRKLVCVCLYIDVKGFSHVFDSYHFTSSPKSLDSGGARCLLPRS